MRKLDGNIKKIVSVYLVAVALFHLFTAVFGAYEAYLQRTIHLTLLLPLAFILYPPTKKLGCGRISAADTLLALLAFLPGIYGIVNYEEISQRIVQFDPVTLPQMVFGALLTLLLLEATRRVVGLPLTLVTIFFVSYMYLGQFFPGYLRSTPFSPAEVIEQIYLTDEGIFSMPLGISATFVAIFLIFSGFMEQSGMGDYFRRLSLALAGKSTGGPAKIAVITSCLFGSISGSAVANVYSTGSFTIPMMKKTGYQPYFAGAVEAVASAGGQIMPPLMGAGAFIMAAFLGVRYTVIITAALIPALLYYGAVFTMVHFQARRLGLKTLTEDLPDKKEVLKSCYLLLPVAILVAMLFSGRTPMLAAVISIGAAWVLSMLSPAHRMGPGKIARALETGMGNAIMIAIACASAGLIVGSVALTGIGFKFVSAIFALSADIPLVALILIMVISIILGMGLPTTSAYILASALCVKVLINYGIAPLAAHLFVFYYAILSNITPPVALAAYAAGSLAGSDPNKTGFTAMSLGIIAFIMPFAFCFNANYLLIGEPLTIVLAIFSGATLVIAVSLAIIGYFKNALSPAVRLFCAAIGLAAVLPNAAANVAAIVVMAGMLFYLAGRKEAVTGA